MGKLNIGLFLLLFCFAVVTICHCLDVKMPKMIQLLLFFPTRAPFLLAVAAARAGLVVAASVLASGEAPREGTGPYLRLSLTPRSSPLSCVQCIVPGRSFC